MALHIKYIDKNPRSGFAWKLLNKCASDIDEKYLFISFSGNRILIVLIAIVMSIRWTSPLTFLDYAFELFFFVSCAMIQH